MILFWSFRFIMSGWLLVAVTFILCGFFVILNKYESHSTLCPSYFYARMCAIHTSIIPMSVHTYIFLYLHVNTWISKKFLYLYFIYYPWLKVVCCLGDWQIHVPDRALIMHILCDLLCYVFFQKTIF